MNKLMVSFFQTSHPALKENISAIIQNTTHLRNQLLIIKDFKLAFVVLFYQLSSFVLHN